MRSPAIDGYLSRAKQRVFLDVGQNSIAAPGWTVLDDRDEAQIKHDPLVFPWPLDDASTYYIRCFHVVEHIPLVCQDHPRDALLDLFDEMWRVLCPGGTAWITCPHQSTRQAWADPTNRRLLNEDVFKYTSRDIRERDWPELDLGCNFDVSHGFTLSNDGSIVEMHVSLSKGGPTTWQAPPLP